VSKFTSADVLERMVKNGHMEKNRYMLSSGERDQRWAWVYCLNATGANYAIVLADKYRW